MKAPKSSANRVLPEEGQTEARCYLVVYAGHFKTEYKGKPKITPKLYLSFETPSLTHVFNDEKGEEPFSLTVQLPFSMHKKSGLRKFIESWRGKKYANEEEAEEFEFEKMLGHTGLITIEHSEYNGSNYANINSIVPLPKAMKCADPINTPVFYNIEEPDPTAFARLPEWLRNKIMEAEEHQTPAKEDLVKAGAKDTAPVDSEGDPLLDGDDDSDIPF